MAAATSTVLFTVTPLAGVDVGAKSSAPAFAKLTRFTGSNGKDWLYVHAAEALGSTETVRVGIDGSASSDAGSAGWSMNAPGGIAQGQYGWCTQTSLNSPPSPSSYTTGAAKWPDSAAATIESTDCVITTSATGTLSAWIYIVDTVPVMGFTTTPGVYWTIKLPDFDGTTLYFDFWDNTNTKHFEFHVVTAITMNAWHHVLMSVDTNHAAGLKVGKVTLNGVSQSVVVTSDTSGAFAIGWGEVGETLTCNTTLGSMADWWLAPGQYLDVSSAPVIAKFYSGGKPVDLGANGATPTGSAPRIFFRRAPAASPDSFATNLGTTGAFSVISGPLEAAPSSPAD